MVSIIESFGLSKADFNKVNYKAFKKALSNKYEIVPNIGSRQFQNYKTKFGYSRISSYYCNICDCRHKSNTKIYQKHKKNRVNEPNTTKINRNHYNAIDGAKLNDIGFIGLGLIQNKKMVKITLFTRKLGKNEDYHNLENKNNEKLVSDYIDKRYPITSDFHNFYKYGFEGFNKNFIKNKNCSISPERRIAYIKYLLGNCYWNLLDKRIKQLQNEGIKIQVIKVNQ